jgi:hypothetical protein
VFMPACRHQSASFWPPVCARLLLPICHTICIFLASRAGSICAWLPAPTCIFLASRACPPAAANLQPQCVASLRWRAPAQVFTPAWRALPAPSNSTWPPAAIYSMRCPLLRLGAPPPQQAPPHSSSGASRPHNLRLRSSCRQAAALSRNERAKGVAQQCWPAVRASQRARLGRGGHRGAHWVARSKLPRPG